MLENVSSFGVGVAVGVGAALGVGAAVGVGVTTATSFFQTNFFPDLRQVYIFF